MNINIDITDQQAANLAAMHRVSTFTDGNDLITQVLADADLNATRRAVMRAASISQSQDLLDAMASAVTASGGAISLPPIKIKPTL